MNQQKTFQEYAPDQLTLLPAFIEWLATHHLGATHWRLLTRQMLREYMAETLPTASANHIRLTMQPVTQTARHMWLEHEVPNVAERLGTRSTRCRCR
jgi:hypothetical protein